MITRFQVFGILMAAALSAGIGGFAALPVAGQAKTKDDPKTEAKLNGTWNVTAMEMDGKAIPEAVATQLAYVFADTKATLKGRVLSSGGNYIAQAGDLECAFKVNSSKKPNEIDIALNKDKTILGIYALNGNDLKACLSYSIDRPKEFSTKGKNGVVLLTLKRS